MKTLAEHYEERLNESSLSRLWRHNESHDCGALTAFRKGEKCGEGKPYSKKDNKARNKSLHAKLMKLGYDLTSIKGKYPEGGVVGKEESFFVVDSKDNGNIEKDLKKLGTEFDQDSVLVIPMGSITGDSDAYLISTNKCPNAFPGFGKLGVKAPFNKGQIGYDSPIYTSYVNGRPFIFTEDIQHVHTPANGYGWWALNMFAEKDWTELLDEEVGMGTGVIGTGDIGDGVLGDGDFRMPNTLSGSVETRNIVKGDE